MTWIQQFSAIIFDGDGVLFDSEELTLDAFSHAMAHWGLSFTREDLNPWVGVATPQVLEQVKAKLGVAIPVAEFCQRRDDSYVEICQAQRGPKPRRGVVELLDWMDSVGMPKAVGSNASRAKVDFNLRQSGLADRFSISYSVDDVVHGKPDPEMFLRAARDMGVSPERCLVMEDAISGLKAARAGGMVGVAVLGSLPTAMLNPHATAVYEDPAEFLATVLRVRGNP